jgi:multiple sugar transport system permease protein
VSAQAPATAITTISPRPTVIPPRRPPRGSVEHRRARAAWAFLAPALIVIVTFVLLPMAKALWTSFTDAGLIGGGDWVGLENYTSLPSDERFTNALGNTLTYAVVTTPVSVATALGLALALNRRLPARGLFRAAVFLPFVASMSILAIAWSYLFDPRVGALSAWLEWIGIDLGNGVDDPDLALPAVMFVGIWRNVGFFMVMFLAGLQSIPKELNEAATIDGAGAWTRFRHITMPLLSNTTMFVVVIAAIFSFQAFDQIYTMTGGGPFFQSETLVMLVYSRGFQNYDMGSATAISWVLVAIVLVISLLQLGYFNRRVVRY